jgi:hypothetical protein
MKKHNLTTQGHKEQTHVQTRDFNAEVAAMTVIFLVLFVLCIGEPDIIDGIIHTLMK